jgi:hypothetical protein
MPAFSAWTAVGRFFGGREHVQRVLSNGDIVDEMGNVVHNPNRRSTVETAGNLDKVGFAEYYAKNFPKALGDFGKGAQKYFTYAVVLLGLFLAIKIIGRK